MVTDYIYIGIVCTNLGSCTWKFPFYSTLNFDYISQANIVLVTLIQLSDSFSY